MMTNQLWGQQTLEKYWGHYSRDPLGNVTAITNVWDSSLVSAFGYGYDVLNENVTEHVDFIGNTVAHYEYDAFGNFTGQSGSMADDFKHRFSTKYLDAETGNIHFDHRPYKPSFGRFISRDPIEEQGGLNLYGFCGNDPINKWDYLGMWKIERKGEPWAIARAETGDTFDSLARLLKLDTSDYKIWADTQDEYPDLCNKDYYIPNTIYYHFGDLTGLESEDEWFGQYRFWDRGVADASRANGHNVVWVENNVSSDTVIAALGDKYLERYYFTGHSRWGGFLSASPSHIAAARYTRHGICLLQLRSCWSADKNDNAGKDGYHYQRNPWEQNVATRGWFVGYEGITSLQNASRNFRRVPGTNWKGGGQ